MPTVGLDKALIPPAEMLIDGSSSPQQFVFLGEGFCQQFVLARAMLPPSGAILDLGCGNGAIARALTKYLASDGCYEGLDIHAASVEWLTENYKLYPNFRFTHADVYNKMYNPAGKDQARDYVLPFPDHTFDVVVLKSVFTHMLPPDVRHYLQEISRVLKRGGRSIITYFLLNPEAAVHGRGARQDVASARLRG